MKRTKTLVTDALLRILESPWPGDEKHRTGATLLSIRLFKSAVEGSVPAANMILERIEGKVKDQVELTTEPRSEDVIERIHALVRKLRQPVESQTIQ